MDIDDILMYATESEIVDGIAWSMDYIDSIELDELMIMISLGKLQGVARSLEAYFKDDELLEARKQENETLIGQLNRSELNDRTHRHQTRKN